MKSGTLFYNCEKQRIGIAFADGSVHESLHCGECLEAFVDTAVGSPPASSTPTIGIWRRALTPAVYQPA